MSLHADYLRERGGRYIRETDDGFATYSLVGQECYIEDVYVVPEKRKSGLASSFVTSIADEAKSKGCSYLITSVVPSANGSTESLKAVLAYGFRLLRSQPDFIVLRKDI